MRKELFFFLSVVLVLLVTVAACTESFSERCRREAKEFTLKQCPRLLSEAIILDSMVYTDEPEGFIYYHTVQGVLDNDSLLTEDRLQDFREQLLNGLRNDLNLRRYKERGFTFTYSYQSASKHALFTSATFGPEDYQ